MYFVGKNFDKKYKRLESKSQKSEVHTFFNNKSIRLKLIV